MIVASPNKDGRKTNANVKEEKSAAAALAAQQQRKEVRLRQKRQQQQHQAEEEDTAIATTTTNMGDTHRSHHIIINIEWLRSLGLIGLLWQQ